MRLMYFIIVYKFTRVRVDNRLDISSIKELLETKQITSVNWCDTDKQLADSLTKKGASPKILRNTLESGLLFDMFV